MAAAQLTPPPPPPPPAVGSRPTAPSRSRTGGIVLVVLGAVIALIAAGLCVGGGALMMADRSLRDGSGYLTSPTVRVSAPDYAIAATDINLALTDPNWHISSEALGTVRITATSSSPAGVFLGVGPRAAVLDYLRGVAYDVPGRWLGSGTGFDYTVRQGGPPAAAPSGESLWVAQTAGQGTQTLSWTIESGNWAVVLMNADASRGIAADVSIAATAPFLFPLALGLLIGGAVAVLVAAALIAGGTVLLRPGSPPRSSPLPPSLAGQPHPYGV